MRYPQLAVVAALSTGPWHIVISMEPLLNNIPPAMRPGNVVSTAVLGRHGLSKNDVRRLVRRGHLALIRRGWYALPGADTLVLRAIRSGGILGCASALQFHGAWGLLDTRLHVYRTDWGQRQPAGEVGWCPSPHTRLALPTAVAPIDLAIKGAKRCLSTEDLLAQVESLINSGRLSQFEAEQLMGTMAWRLDRAESGTETKVRHRLRRLRLPVRSQVWINGVGRVDLLVGDRLVIEVDSKAHHLNHHAYQSDRVRDQVLLTRGYLVIRVTWEQVMFDWDEVEARILTLCRARAHRGRVIAP